MTDVLTCRDALCICPPSSGAHAALDRRGIIKHPTRIEIRDDRLGRRAVRIAETLNSELERFRKYSAGIHEADTVSDYDALRRRARSLGFDYNPNSELLALSQEIARPVSR